MLSISTWWNAFSIQEQVLWVIALSSSSILLIQMIMMFIGGDLSDMDADGHPDVAVDSDTGIAFQFLSFKNFIAFFAMFGWTGIVCLRSGMPIGWSVLIAFFAGFVTMLAMAGLMYGLHKLNEDGSIRLKDAIGVSGTCYLTIPPKRTGEGQVQINLNGLRTLEAMTDHDTQIKTGQLIEVVDEISNVLIVKPK